MYDQVSEENKSDQKIEAGLKELCQLLIRNEIIKAESEDIEVVQFGRMYLITHESSEVFRVE